jgi:hypothetical protein
VCAEGRFYLAFSWGMKSDAFCGSSFEAYQRTGGRCSVLGGIADFGGSELSEPSGFFQRLARGLFQQIEPA